MGSVLDFFRRRRARKAAQKAELRLQAFHAERAVATVKASAGSLRSAIEERSNERQRQIDAVITQVMLERRIKG